MEKTWKQMYKDHLQQRYGAAAERWRSATGDRRVFANCYRTMQEALDSLDDNPNFFVTCAMANRISDVMKVMDEIAETFKGK